MIIEPHGDVAVLRMQAGKANAMSSRMLTALARGIDDAAGAKALVITGEGNAFSAGLALPEIIDFDRAAMAQMIDQLEDTMHRVLTWPRATIAAINGHAFAGGCVLALMCDVREMAEGSAKIGLNEIQLGIGLPALVVETLRVRVPPEAFAAIALEGHLFSPHEAQRIGLVDNASSDPLAASLAIANARTRGHQAYAQIKAAMLAPVLAAWHVRRPIERESWLDSWFSDDAQRGLRAAVERLRKR